MTFEKRPGDQRSLDEVLCEEAIANPECLPLLEFVLHELYELGQGTRVLSFKDYDALGKMSGAIERTAKQLFENLGGDAQEALEQVLLPLSRISQDEGQVARRHVPYSHWDDRPACQALVEAFVDHRLFVKQVRPDGEVHVAVAHEAVLREWDLAKQVIGDNRRILQMRERVCQQRDLWSQQQEAESYLLQAGLALAEGVELAGQFREGLSREDLRYIAISEKVVHRAERKRQQWIVTRTALLFLVFVGVVVTVLVSQKRIADEQAASASAEVRRQQFQCVEIIFLPCQIPPAITPTTLG
ncbi:MAG: hypothetical protein HC888_11075 [Candidatus Competibacteraceae bacterium]|nr:hypothetical protein [Candidatus Competibacteraceae bacterium]